MAARPAVEVNVGGQLYRLVASTGEQSVRRYAGIVNERLRELTGSERPGNPQTILLVAMALAHDLVADRSIERGMQILEQTGAEDIASTGETRGDFGNTDRPTARVEHVAPVEVVKQ